MGSTVNASIYPYSANDNDYNNPIPNPTCFTDQAIQTETDFITQSLNEDAQQTNFNNAFYSGMRHNLNEAFSEMDESSDHAQEAVNDHHYTQRQADNVQAINNAASTNTPGFFSNAEKAISLYRSYDRSLVEGVIDSTGQILYSTGVALENPEKTLIGMLAAGADD